MGHRINRFSPSLCVHEKVGKNVKSILEFGVVAGTIKFEFDLREIIDNVIDVDQQAGGQQGIQKDIEFDCCSVNLIYFPPVVVGCV